MFSNPSSQIAAFSALQTACRQAAEQELREGSLRPVPPARSGRGRLAGVLASAAVALTLLQTVAAAFVPATAPAETVAAAPVATTVR